MRVIAAVLFVSLVAAVAAEASAPALTPTAYRSKASVICKGLNSWVPPSSGTLAERFAAIIEEAASVRNALKKLEPPPSLAPLHAKVLALEGRDIDYFRTALGQLRAGKIGDAQLIAAFAKAPSGTDEDRIWKRIGVPACVQG